MSRSFIVLLAAEVVVAAELCAVALDAELGVAARVAGTAAAGLLLVMGAAALRRGGLAQATATGILGTLGVAAGGGVGGGHLVLEGLTLDVLTGIPALLAGLVLLGHAGSVLVRTLHGWRRLAIVPVAFVLAQFLLLPLGYAFAGTHVARSPFTAPVATGAQRVTVPTSDGVTLAGWYTPSRNGAAVVLLPGSGGNKADTSGHAAALTRHGYGVLALDPRGLGESGGQGMLWGWGGERDIAAGLDFLASRPEVDRRRLGVVGLSMGAEQGLTAAALDGRIAAVVAEGAEARMAGDLGHLRTDDLVSLITRANCFVAWLAADALTDAPMPIPLSESVRRAAPTPVLLIAADEPNERAANRELQAAAPASVELWEPAGAGHIGALWRYPDEWERRVIAILDRSLAGR